MRATTIDISGWAARNMWPLPSGELAVRPGLRKVYSAASGRRLVGGFSLRSPSTLEMVHYVVDVATSGAADCRIRVLDAEMNEFHQLAVGNVEPEVVTRAVLQQQVLICSPHFPTVWGFVGGPIAIAPKASSQSGVEDTIDMPRGLAVSWASSRAVIADGDTIFVSDPTTVLSPNALRSFAGSNATVLESPILGLHVSARGALIACTQSGAWALPASAAAIGRTVFGAWERITDYQATRFATTTKAAGRVWGLSAAGVVPADSAGTFELALDDPPIPRALVQRISANDYRAVCRIYEGHKGPIVSYPGLEAVCVVDIAREFASWWTWADATADGRLVGVLQEDDGDDMLLTADGVYRVWGNFDGDEAISEAGTVTGVLAGLQPSPPDGSPVLRRVDVKSDTGGLLRLGFGGTAQTEQPAQAGSVLAAAVWGTGTINTPALASKRFHLADRTDQIAFEVGCDNPLSRLDAQLSLEVRGPGARRPA